MPTLSVWATPELKLISTKLQLLASLHRFLIIFLIFRIVINDDNMINLLGSLVEDVPKPT